jgi:hypothetical protein
MQRKLVGIIIVDVEATYQLRIIYCEFVKYFKLMGKNGAVSQLFIDIKKAYDSVRMEVFYYILIQTVIPMKW